VQTKRAYTSWQPIIREKNERKGKQKNVKLQKKKEVNTIKIHNKELGLNLEQKGGKE